MKLKQTCVALLAGVALGLNGLSQDAGMAADAADEPMNPKQMQKQLRQLNREVNKLRGKLSKDNAEVDAIKGEIQGVLEERKKLDQKRAELETQINDLLAETNPEFKTKWEAYTRLQDQIGAARRAERERRKAAGAKKGAGKKKAVKKKEDADLEM